MLQGGELAAALTPAQRMDLIQRGYSPMNPYDVQAYKQGKRPTEDVGVIAGANDRRFSTMGMTRASERDTIQARQEYNFDFGNVEVPDGYRYDPSELGILGDSNSNFNQSPREELSSKLDSYGNNFGGDLNSKLQSKLSLRGSLPDPARVKSRTPVANMPYDNEFGNDDGLDDFRSIPQTPKTKIIRPGRGITSLTPTDAKKLGVKNGLLYINAFIVNIKNPSMASRVKLIDAMNNMIKAEERIPEMYLKSYYDGVSIAEKAFHNKLKN